MMFHINSAMKHSYLNNDTCFIIDIIDEILEEYFDALLDEGSKILSSIQGIILEEKLFVEFDEFMGMAADENSESESDTKEPPFEKITFNTNYKIKTYLEEPPSDIELKPLPDNLEYVFLEEPSFLPVIISSHLSEQSKNKLIYVLKRHKQAFAWKTIDIPRICLSFCKRKIQLQENKKPVVQKQRRLNPNMQEVVKKEIVKLLDTEFDIKIKDKNGTENVAADHLSRIDNDETSDDSDVYDNFPGETLIEITRNGRPWFSDFANYLEDPYFSKYVQTNLVIPMKPLKKHQAQIQQVKALLKKGRTVTVTTEDMQKRRNDVKVRTTLLLALSDEDQLRFSKYKTAQELWAAILKTFGGNEATKKTKKNQLKQQYGIFKAKGKETLDLNLTQQQKSSFSSSIQQHQLMLGSTKFFTSSIKHLVFFFKLHGSINSKVNSCKIKRINTNNNPTSDLDTVSLGDLYNHLKVYEPEVQKKSKSNSQNMAFISLAKNNSGKEEVNTASILTASTQVSPASANVAAASISLDTFCNMALLSMRADRFGKKTGKKITIQGTDVAGFDKSKVECFNCHKMGHFARECRAPRSQDRGRRENFKQGSKIKESASKALMAIDGVGWDWSYIANEEENHALVEVRLVEFKNQEIKFCKKIRGLEFNVECKNNRIERLTNELEELKKEKEGLDSKLTGLPEFADDTITDYSRPSPSIESNSNDLQRNNSSVYENGESSSSILSKLVITFVKTADSPIEIKTNKDETVRKSSVKYAKMYRKPSKTSKSFNGNSQNVIDDKGYWDSGCSQYINGNISYLSDYEPYDGGYVSFGQGGGKITGKGIIKTGKLEFENVYFMKDLKYNLFSMSQICDNKNNVVFTDSECIVLGRDFKLKDDTNVLLRTPRQHNMFSIYLNNIVPHKDLTCLVAKASADESILWHIRLGHLNFKRMNKLVRHNLVRGLPSICFENNHTCVACLKGKQHKASCKTKLVNSVSKPLNTLHMDLFGPTFISSLNHKWYCLVVTDDFSRFTWTFFLKTKDETSGILRNFITEIENLKELKNEVTKRRNRTLIEAARTMLADATLPVTFWDEAVNTALVVAGTSSTNFSGTKDAASQDVKKDVSSLRYIAFPNWFHDAHLESSTSNAQDACKADSPESSGNSNPTATLKNPPSNQIETLAVETTIPTISSPVPTTCLDDSPEPSSDTRLISKGVTSQDDTTSLDNILNMSNRFEDILEVTTNTDDTNGMEADLGNMENNISASPTPTFRIHKDHLKNQIIGPVDTPVQTRTKGKAHWEKMGSQKKKDERGILIRNKARLVTQRDTQEEGIDYKEVFAPVAMIEAIRLFLAYASFIGFTGKDETGKDVDLHLYRSMIGSLMYLTASRSDIIFVVCACARHQVTPKECHLHAVKRIFRYLKGHPKLGLWYHKESLFDLVAYSDSDYSGATQDRKSTTGGFANTTTKVSHSPNTSFYLLSNPNNTVIMARLAFCDYHNMIAILEKSEHKVDFHQIVDFVEASHIRYALTINPTVYVSHIRQFWSTARIETTNEGTKILATVNGKLRTISKSSIRRNLKLNDDEGINTLPDAELFENLALMGVNGPSFSGRTVPLFDSILFHQGKGSGTPTEPHHTPSLEAPQSPHTAPSSPSLPPATTEKIPTSTPTKIPILRQYSRRVRIAQSSTLPTAADEPASPSGDNSQGEACLTVSGLEAEQDRANLIKTSTLPHDSAPRVTSLVADEGNMQQQLNELTDLYTRLQRQQTEMATKIAAQDLEISHLKARIKFLEDKDEGRAKPSGEDATIKGRSLEIEEEAGVERSTKKGKVSTVGIPTGSGLVPTTSPIFTTASVVTPNLRRKGKEKMVESDTPKKKKLQEQIDVQVAREIKEQMAREDQRRNE
nr:putative ribonuclease H-like domain-containing protein [Tanacetum cinerariifolium]